MYHNHCWEEVFGLAIHIANENNSQITTDYLKNTFSPVMDRKQKSIENTIDGMYDLGIIQYKFTRNKNNEIVKSIYIKGEWKKYFEKIQEQYNTPEKVICKNRLEEKNLKTTR
jgi:hypothetical protein